MGPQRKRHLFEPTQGDPIGLAGRRDRDAKDRDAKDRDAKDRDAKDRDAKDRSREIEREREREVARTQCSSRRGTNSLERCCPPGGGGVVIPFFSGEKACPAGI